MATRDPRITGPTLKVLRLLLTGGADATSGADISKATGVGAGTLYPMLSRLETAGWVSSRWEEIDPKEAGRPRKRFYELTGVGRTRARAELAELQLAPTEGVAVWN